ncbi:hypothetical protein NMY22_g6998 [Coprinellus aureogranulatus]|nr:hypothetical protein NMY22_g6998 [Coprinellus aureogranulatus]
MSSYLGRGLSDERFGWWPSEIRRAQNHRVASSARHQLDGVPTLSFHLSDERPSDYRTGSYILLTRMLGYAKLKHLQRASNIPLASPKSKGSNCAWYIYTQGTVEVFPLVHMVVILIWKP